MKKIEKLYRIALDCRTCFTDEEMGLKAPTIDLAQPRWVGSRYFTAKHRITFVMLNPGAGGKSKEADNKEALNVLQMFKGGKATFKDVLSFQSRHMETWGRPEGRFLHYYIEALALNLEDVAFLNIALCATEKNRHQCKILRPCFEKHTREILRQLNPDLVVLCGAKTRPFIPKIKVLCPTAQIEPMFHHAHREGKEAEKIAQEQLRGVIKKLSKAHA